MISFNHAEYPCVYDLDLRHTQSDSVTRWRPDQEVGVIAYANRVIVVTVQNSAVRKH